MARYVIFSFRFENMQTDFVGMSHFEAVLTSVFYPFTLYAGLRLAHRGFTVGELGLVCLGGTSLCLEFLQLTIAKVHPLP